MQTGGRVLSGAVTSVFGGVTLLWDIYQLRGGIIELAAGNAALGRVNHAKIGSTLFRPIHNLGS